MVNSLAHIGFAHSWKHFFDKNGEITHRRFIRFGTRNQARCLVPIVGKGSRHYRFCSGGTLWPLLFLSPRKLSRLVKPIATKVKLAGSGTGEASGVPLIRKAGVAFVAPLKDHGP